MEDKELIDSEFYERFNGYLHAFETSDQMLQKLSKEDRRSYCDRVRELLEHTVLKQELTEWKRGLFTHLALRTTSELEQSCYRTTLVAIQDFEKRLKSVADRGMQERFQGIADKL